LAPEEFADAVVEVTISDAKPLSEEKESILSLSSTTEQRIGKLEVELKPQQPTGETATENEVPEERKEISLTEDKEQVRTNGHVSCTLAPLASEVITSQKSSDTDMNEFVELSKCLAPLGNLEIIGECDEVCGTKFQEEKEHVDALSQKN
jgi:hypothetical protein